MSNKNNVQYRVLWVDEEKNAVNFVETARKRNLMVHQFSSWQEAKEVLERRFEAFSAIVLDGNCVVNAGEEPNPDFLYQAVRELETIFASHEEQLPWYVLSSGSAPDFESTIRRVGMGERERMSEFWGTLYFKKPEPGQESELLSFCETIQKAASKRKPNKVEHLYRGVFDTLKAYFDPQACNTMLDVLVALHYPEENRNFDPVLYYTQLRRILEYLFRACNKLGVLPDEVLGQDDKVNLANSSLYLAGREVNLGRKVVRFGKPGQSVFPPVIAQIVKSILVVANKNSHSTELSSQEVAVIREYNNVMHSNNFLFGYALHLCDVILWFGNYAKCYKNHK